MIKFLTYFFTFVAFLRYAYSQDADSLDIYDLSLEQLSQLEVFSTSRTEFQNARYAAANITIITQEQIKRRGYENIIDVLEDLPDFKIDRNVDPRWLNDITLRGIRYMDKLIILQDGIRISSPTNEIVPVSHNYPIHHARQIEIIKGPASALYGADAFAGVINIITRTSKNEVSGSINGGMYNTGTVNLYLSKELNDDLSITVGMHGHVDEQPDLAKVYKSEYLGMENELKNGTFNTIFGPITPSTPVDPEKAYPIEARALNARIGYKNLSIGGFMNHIHVPSTTANSPSNAVYNEEQFFGHDIKMVTANYKLNLNDKILSNSQATYSDYDLDQNSNFRNVFTAMEPAYKFSASNKLKFEQLLTWSINSNFKITSGATYERFHSIPRSGDLQFPISMDNLEDAIIVNSIAPNNPDGIPAELIETTYTNIGGLVQFRWNMTNWDAIVGGRLDRDDRFSATFNPRLGFVYHPDGKSYVVKGTFGRAFLAPSPQNIFDRFGTFSTQDDGQTYAASFYHLPNPNLKPQTVSTVELSGKIFLDENFTVDASAYYSDVKNLITQINSGEHPDRIMTLYPNNEYEIAGQSYPIDLIEINDNLGESIIIGSSISLNYKNPIGVLNHAFVNYSYITGTLDIDEEGPIQKRNLPGVSPHMVKIGSTLRFGSLHLDTRLNIVSKQHTIGPSTVKQSDPSVYQEIDGYLLLNAHLRYILSDRITFSISGRNITNQKYRNINIGASPEDDGGTGSGSVEFSGGAPQNPIRITGGISFKL
ncbi:TonB-dependent receptor plug domain-containing protein [Ekhidna sp.]|uniref:TonB-dependent receptor plug domain-containing protein n=1 Tax=Ekhidna sp. TaxID=2608089 RepID=UPI003B503F88